MTRRCSVMGARLPLPVLPQSSTLTHGINGVYGLESTLGMTRVLRSTRRLALPLSSLAVCSTGKIGRTTENPTAVMSLHCGRKGSQNGRAQTSVLALLAPLLMLSNAAFASSIPETDVVACGGSQAASYRNGKCCPDPALLACEYNVRRGTGNGVAPGLVILPTTQDSNLRLTIVGRHLAADMFFCSEFRAPLGPRLRRFSFLG